MADEIEIKSGSKVGPLAFSGDYVELAEVIGTGAQGQVFACRREQKPGQRLAAKVVDSQRLQLMADDPEAVVKKLESEVRILRNAEHDHCVSLYDIYRTKRWIVLVMERLEGGELFEQIAKKRTLQEFEAKHVLRQIVSGLQFLHQKHIAHRDLKPENILISKMQPAESPHEGCTLYDIKIADYGLSKYSEEELKSLVGTPQYWAPEMLFGQGRDSYDQRVDLWSLGVLLYVMLYGRYPFKGEDANEQIKAARFDLSRPKGEPSEEAKDLIRKLLKVKPAERLSLQGCLEHPWLSEGKGAEVPQPEPVSAVQLATPAPRRLPLDLQQLLQLQMSLGRSLQIACLACRQSHPDLSAKIRETIMQAYMLWQHALKVVGTYAQVSRKVTERVLPDLELAVQESEPDLGFDLLGMVEGWIQQMTSDGETTHKLCDELSQQMGRLITQAQKEHFISEGQVEAPRQGALCDASQLQQTRQDLLDGLMAFAEQMAKGKADEAKSQDLVELLFMSPGAPELASAKSAETAKSASEEGRPSSSASTEKRSEDSQKKAETAAPSVPAAMPATPTAATPATPATPAATPATPATPATAAVELGELALQPAGVQAPSGSVHPLLRALCELHQVGDILRQCTAFWGHIESTVQELARSKDHTQSLLRYASKSQRLKERFDQRLAEYSAFWASLLALCEQYCAEVQPALQHMSAFIRDMEVAADVRVAAAERIALCEAR